MNGMARNRINWPCLSGNMAVYHATRWGVVEDELCRTIDAWLHEENEYRRSLEDWLSTEASETSWRFCRVLNIYPEVLETLIVPK